MGCTFSPIRRKQLVSGAIPGPQLNRQSVRDGELTMGMFKVRRTPCVTCIYRKASNFDIVVLEDPVRDKHIGFKGHRICHHTKDACCRGFWNRHKDDFPLGQVAQRLGRVEFVDST